MRSLFLLLALVPLSPSGQTQGDNLITERGKVVDLITGIGMDNILEALNNMANMPCADSWNPGFFHFNGFKGAAEMVLDAFEDGEVNLGYKSAPGTIPGTVIGGRSDHNTISISPHFTSSCEEMATIWHEAQHFFRGGPINACDHGELYTSTQSLMEFLNANCGCSISKKSIAVAGEVAALYNELCSW